ncbi:MAG: beta-propeller fold lactonase family protein [Verrucomicrobiota bacterium]|nr:beta-propeller fold lactonase family protein [Verrucomicrobiota bacterium]
MKIEYVPLCTSLWLLACLGVNAAELYVANNGSNNVSVINSLTNRVTATLPVGTAPLGVAMTPDGSYAYVANYIDNNISVIDASANKVIGTVAVGRNPWGVATTADGAYAYVVNNGSNSISVIDTTTNAVIGTVPSGDSPRGIVTMPNGPYAYVCNYRGNNVSVINTATHQVEAMVSVGKHPTGIAITPDGAHLYAVNSDSNSVSVIDTATNQVIATVPVGKTPWCVAITPNGAHAYVANHNSSSISIISTATNKVTETIAAGTSPVGIAISPNGSHAYVTSFYSNSVNVINTLTKKIAATIPVGANPGYGLTLGVSAPRYSALLNENKIWFVETDGPSLQATPVHWTAIINLAPESILLSNKKMHAYVTDKNSNAITSLAINYKNSIPRAVVSGAPLAVGTRPSAMALSPDENYLFVADDKENSIYRINLANNSVVQLVTLNAAPGNISLNPKGDYLVIAIPSLNQVVMVASPTGTGPFEITTTTINAAPEAFAFDGTKTSTGKVYVTCSNALNCNLKQLDLSTGTITKAITLIGSSPSAIKRMTIDKKTYFLITMADSRVNLVGTSPFFAVVSYPSIDVSATQIFCDPLKPSVAYLLQPSTNTVQSIDFTSSTLTPTLGNRNSGGSTFITREIQ